MLANPKTLVKTPWMRPRLGRREDRRDGGEHHRHQDARADPLEPPEDDQLGEILGEPAERRRQHEEGGAADQEQLAPVDVRELADDRDHGGAAEQVRCGDPGVMIEALKLGDDPRHRGADDRLVERREQQRHHQADDRQDQALAGKLVVAGWRRPRRSRGRTTEDPSTSVNSFMSSEVYGGDARIVQRRGRVGAAL